MRSCAVLILFLGIFKVGAQVKISGKLTDFKGKSIAGASVSILNSYDGTTTDSLGNFSFETTEKGGQILEASMSGYTTYNKKIQLENQSIQLNISIKELITELNAVVISAGSFEAGDKKKTTVLSSLDIVTTAGANADITSTLKTLPGTQQVGESEGLFVRGGTATESKIFIDGNLVNNFYYSSLPGIATRGRFNPFLFKGTVFSSGGYSALYGQALSSALVLESTDLPEKTEASLSMSVIGAGAGIQKLAKNKKASWGLTYNYINLALAFAVIKQKQDFYRIPQYHELDANFRIKTKNGGFIKYYGYGSWNRIGFRAPDIDSSVLQDAFSLQNLNTYQNINWRENIGHGWKTFAGLSYSTNKDNISNELQDPNDRKVQPTDPPGYAFKNFSLKNRSQYAQARIVLEKRIQGLNVIRFGADHFYSDEKATYTLYNGDRFTNRVTDHLTAGFAETDFYLTKDIAAKLGARTEYSQLMKKWNLAPRASIAYKFDKTSQLSFAYGIFYQNPETKYLPAVTASLGYAKATHYILQFQRVNNQRTLRTEIFYKNYNALYKTEPNAHGVLVATNNTGSGYAKGAELFWRDKKTVKNLDYWVSYSYLDTKRNYLNFPGQMAPNFAASHTASLVLKKFSLPLKTGFNASYNFASGRPYYQLAFDQSQDKYVVKDEGKTINYNSLGFSLNYLPNLGNTGKKSFIVWVLSVTNVLGQKQVYGYNYASITDRKVPITPSSKRFVYIGCFLSFGVDRTQDAINNNL
jgi:hypothetical protein